MAIFCGAVTAALYLLGLLTVGMAVSETGEGADSTTLRTCRTSPHRPPGAHVLAHEVRFMPLRVMCRTSDGRRFSSGLLPSWFNPALAASFAGTGALTAGALVQAKRRAARSRHAGQPSAKRHDTTVFSSSSSFSSSLDGVGHGR
ncbi:hypothetical protein [Streptomyces sp. MNP-20]|uniref:hypothetical protein n=1 Tax=Streptomyces sp. MNP-20 TaxID=2721165 RepID=UPI001C1E0204|nr:hypothetical protein [Streptomyces sp. MNP-20]